jgi:formylglycine-generating enzyme required for sulfatase activity
VQLKLDEYKSQLHSPILILPARVNLLYKLTMNFYKAPEFSNLPLFLMVFMGIVAARAADPVVSNVRAAQRPGTKLVDIYYDVADADGDKLTISVAVSDTGGATYTVSASTFSGDVGANITPGTGKRITWNAGQDWNDRFSANMRFKVTASDSSVPPPPSGMVLIPAGSFQMGDTFNEGDSDERPVHTVYVSAFYMDRTEVTKALWDEVYQWAVVHGYSFDYAGLGKAANHPVQTIDWYDAVKWCNARSQREGRVPAYYTNATQTTVYRSGRVDVQNSWVKWNSGYRLPAEAEWEKAARGGLSGKRFPWGDTITHSQANYYSDSSYSYDVSPTRGYHPTFNDRVYPYTSPVGHFAANDYGLYDMAGNVLEWCWDWYGSYSAESVTDPRGPTSGSLRVFRGGGWSHDAWHCRAAYRKYYWPDFRYYYLGFRSVLPPGQP